MRAARSAGAAILVLAVLAGGAARAEPPHELFGGASLLYGTSGRPSRCQDYCRRAWGPGLEGSFGGMIGDDLALRGDLWLFGAADRAVALGAMLGAQLWLGDGLSVRGSLGGAGFATDNADGGPGAGLGITAALTGSFQLWQRKAAAADLELRAILLETPQIGFVLFAFGGLAMRWD